ncbi:MAG: hypothetical protein ACXAE3_12115 [Candidatus Kariarchaeaceae archaeon]|jgi:hypothetical protein
MDTFDFDESHIRDLFDEMVQELKNTEENQKSLQRDFHRRKLTPLAANSRYIRDHLHLRYHGN